MHDIVCGNMTYLLSTKSSIYSQIITIIYKLNTCGLDCDHMHVHLVRTATFVCPFLRIFGKYSS